MQGNGWDIIIIGGGLSGLTLALQASKSEAYQNKKILVLEKRTQYAHDKSWCFWDDPVLDDNLRPLVSHSWHEWSFSCAGDQNSLVHRSACYPYHMIRGGDFYDYALSEIGKVPHVHLEKGVCVDVVEKDRVHADGTTYYAGAIIDTRPPPLSELQNATFVQLFYGLEVGTDYDCFCPDRAGLMENLHTDEEAVCFVYKLPLSARSALIEYTVFAPAYFDPETLREKAQEYLPPDARIQRIETGALPMGLPPPQNKSYSGGGMRGRLLRPATGYSFLSVQKWARAMVNTDRLAAETRFHPPFKGLYLMDDIFLHALRKNPAQGPDWYMRLARALDGDGFARFLSEKPRALDLLKVMKALPTGIFLKEAGRTLLNKACRK